MSMFTAKDLISGNMVGIDSIEFTGGEISSVEIWNGKTLETRPNGEDLALFLYGKPI